MVELAIDVKHSAYKISKQDADEQKKVTRVCVYIFLALMLPITPLLLIAEARYDKAGAPHWMTVYYGA